MCWRPPSTPTATAATRAVGPGTGCGWRCLEYPIRDPAEPSCRARRTPRDELVDDLQRCRRVLRGARQQWGDELARSLRALDHAAGDRHPLARAPRHMDYMRQGIGLRGYAQKDPLVEYRSEGQMMFDEMSFLIKQEVVRVLMHAEIEVEEGGDGSAPSVPARSRLAAASTTSTPMPPRWSRWRPRPAPRRVAGDAAGGRAAHRRPREGRRPQRSLLVRQRQEVQAVPWRIAKRPPGEPRSLDDLRGAVEEIRAQLHWVRDYL